MKLENVKWPAGILMVVGIVLIVVGGGNLNTFGIVGGICCAVAVVPPVIAGVVNWLREK